MPHWVLKMLAHKGISYLPSSHKWNLVLQEYVTKSLSLTPPFYQRKLMECRMHLGRYLAAAPGGTIPGTVFELGTGWYPIIPLGLFVCGASRIWTFDIEPWLTANGAKAVARLLLRSAEQEALRSVLPWVRRDRLSLLESLLEGQADGTPAAALLEPLGIFVRVGDALQTGLEEASIKFIVSNTTLQYIRRDVLPGIFAEFRRIAAADAIMSHHHHDFRRLFGVR